MALIKIRGLSTVFGPRPQQALQQVHRGADRAGLLAQGHTLALHDIDLDIRDGEFFVIMGLSGSGKSTLVRHINRLVEPTAGQVSIAGQDVSAMNAAQLIELRRHRLSMVFQGFGLLDHLSVLDNVALGLELRGLPRLQRQARAMHWIERVALQGFEHHRPAQLSGGMRQRVGLARALCSETDIILMDEAFSALDPLIRSQLQAELLALQGELGRTVVFITHDVDEALRLGDRVAILRDGRLVQVGTPDEVLLEPADEQIAAFLGDVNRARALSIGAARIPWPQDEPAPPLEQAVDASESIEQALPMLLGRSTPVALRRGEAIVGQVSIDLLRDLLARPR